MLPMPMVALLDIFPVEIIEAVLSALVEDDNNLEALKACSLTCHALLPHCRKHIFGTITIRPPFSTGFICASPIRLFGQLIRNSPEIATYVRHLRLGLQIEDFSYEELPDVLGQLTQLRGLFIWFCSGYTVLDWKHMPVRFWPIRSSLLRLLLSPTVTSLKLHNIVNFPISTLMQSTSLKELHIEKLTIEDEHDMSSPLPLTPVQLKTLDIGLRANKVALRMLKMHHINGSSVFDLESLKKLHMSIEVSGDMADAVLLCGLASNLSDIHLKVLNGVKLSKLSTIIGPSVKYLELAIWVYSHRRDPFSGICEELTGNNGLETLSLCLRIDTDAEYDIGDEWGHLDRVLVQPVRSALKHFSLKVVLYSYGQSNKMLLERIKGLPQTHFSSIASKCSVRFTFLVEEIMHPSVHDFV
ncbi:hypothetical protein CPC08DRAFT_816742 [Agrocybe pediades]|nr:hypothetical protein CPC08DRAFT_816742 [Agrocybe pediades]